MNRGGFPMSMVCHSSVVYNSSIGILHIYWTIRTYSMGYTPQWLLLSVLICTVWAFELIQWNNRVDHFTFTKSIYRIIVRCDTSFHCCVYRWACSRVPSHSLSLFLTLSHRLKQGRTYAKRIQTNRQPEEKVRNEREIWLSTSVWRKGSNRIFKFRMRLTSMLWSVYHNFDFD